jgi:formylglycine-generating enzyme required for sulfatase activity
VTGGLFLVILLAATTPPPQTDGAPPAPPAPAEGMVLVPAGEALIGDDEGDPDEVPAVRLPVTAFFLDRTEVTNDAYRAFVGETRHPVPGIGATDFTRWAWVDGEPRKGTGDDPVFLVTWADADAYCRWAGKRLPTELEWERAARGDDGRRWAWGDRWEGDEARANWFERKEFDGHTHVAPADSYPGGASPFGVLNMTGNVWEWVADPYVEQPAWKVGADHASAADTGFRVVRGGSWYTNNWYWMRASFRYFLPADEVSTIYGFRCAMDVPPAQTTD